MTWQVLCISPCRGHSSRTRSIAPHARGKTPLHFLASRDHFLWGKLGDFIDKSG